MPIKKIHNVETGEVIEREMTEAEYAQHLLDEEEGAKFIAAQLAAAAKRQALLDKLGITEDEARLLLGGN